MVVASHGLQSVGLGQQVPQFVQQPSFEETVCAGDSVTTTLVEINFFDGENPTVQWQFNGADLNSGGHGGRVTIVTDLSDPSAATTILTIDDTDPGADAALTPLTPPLVLGDDESHTIAFDDSGLLYHHSRDPGVHSRLTRRDLSNPDQEEILRDYATNVAWTAMTIRDDLFIAARRSSPGELWSIDLEGGTYLETVLGPINAQGVSNRTVMGLVFTCGTSGDADCDGDVDLADYSLFQDCTADASPPMCAAFDHDSDGDIDLLDWSALQLEFTGSG